MKSRDTQKERGKEREGKGSGHDCVCVCRFRRCCCKGPATEVTAREVPRAWGRGSRGVPGGSSVGTTVIRRGEGVR